MRLVAASVSAQHVVTHPQLVHNFTFLLNPLSKSEFLSFSYHSKASNMGTLNINDIEIGMELAEDVTNFNGTILLKVGAIITEKHLMAFKVWGITEANIEGVEESKFDELFAVDAETNAMMDQELAYIFQKNDMEDPVIAEIYRLVKKRRISLLTHE